MIGAAAWQPAVTHYLVGSGPLLLPDWGPRAIAAHLMVVRTTCIYLGVAMYRRGSEEEACDQT